MFCSQKENIKKTSKLIAVVSQRTASHDNNSNNTNYEEK